MKPAALLLLAAAASQLDLSQSLIMNGFGEMDISSCPISFYGRSSSWMEVAFSQDSPVEVCFKSEQSLSSRDCLTLSGGGSNIVDVTIQPTTTGPGSDLHDALTDITTNSTCSLSLELKTDSSDLMKLYFYNFDKQAALKVLTFPDFKTDSVLIASLGGSTRVSWNFSKKQTSKGAFMDISGCRGPGSILTPDTAFTDAVTCTREACSPSAVLTVTTCGPSEVCLGDYTCQPPFVCTVTGSTVIDFYNRGVSIEDRCDYTLMRPQGTSDDALMAGFQDGRRKDVSFLDHLTIKLLAGNIYLGQGGRVVVGNKTLHLSTTAQVVLGVKLSKDQTGVTAELPSSNMKVFFDGNTAHVSGPMEAVEGLCGNPINESQIFNTTTMKSSTSASGCSTQHYDTIDITTNCSRSSEQCDLLKRSPFSACHNHTDPAPYVDACKHTLCKYPAVDGLDCQFMEAYAESCRLKTNISLSDWRSKVNCSDS